MARVQDYDKADLLRLHEERTQAGLIPAIEGWWTPGYYGEKRERLTWVHPGKDGAVWGAPDGTHYSRIDDFPDWLARIAQPDLEVRA